MKIQKLLLSANDTQYPYKFRIEIPRDNLTKVETVQDWVKETNFKCCIVPGAVYVRTEQDAMMFILKWA